MDQNFSFFLSNIISILLISTLVLLVGRSLIRGVLKEGLAFVLTFLSFTIAWNFHTNRPYLFEDLAFTQSTSQLMVLLVFFFICMGFGSLVLHMVGTVLKAKRMLLLLPIAIIFTCLSFIIHVNFVYILVSRYFSQFIDDMEASIFYIYITSIHKFLEKFFATYLNFIA